MFQLSRCLRPLVCSGAKVSTISLHTNTCPTIKTNPRLISTSGNYCSESDTEKKKHPCKFEAVRLKSRSLIKLQGPDTPQLLQGLITNDITHLETRPAIYALFLNNQGRVLWDTLIFNLDEDSNVNTYLECDSSIKNKLIKHLKLYRLRKKVQIIDTEEESPVDLWVVFDHAHTSLTKELVKEECCGPVLQQTSKRPDFPVSVNPSLRSFGDPRLNELGWRIFVPRNQADVFPPSDIVTSDEANYIRLRYSLGVAEGVKELPEGNCFPLESNGDYMHGVSFHKGCYVGQELTARTHHTGVIRKRIMPIRFAEDTKLDNTDVSSLQLTSSSGKSLGKIRGVIGQHGIGLIRIEDALSSTNLQIQNINVNIEKPFWWPKEVSKEKLTRQ